MSSRAGSDLPLLLIPGMMCDGRIFSPQLSGLKGRDIRVVSVTGHDSMEALAAEILSTAPSEFALAGHSMGGIVAMEIIRQASERVSRLSLFATNPLAESEEVRSRRQPQMALVEQGRLAEVMGEAVIPHYLASRCPRRAEIERLCMDMALSLGPDVFIRQSLALQSRSDQCATLAGYRGKSLIFHGVEDRLCPSDRHELLHQLLAGSRYEVLEDAGHLPTLEQPEAVTALLEDWLS